MDFNREEKEKAVHIWQNASSHHIKICDNCGSKLISRVFNEDVTLFCDHCKRGEPLSKDILEHYKKRKGSFICKGIDGEDKHFDTITEMMNYILNKDTFSKRMLNKLTYPYYKLLYSLQNFYYRLKSFFQKVFRGYSDPEVWSLSSYLHSYIYPRLKAFVEMERQGYPSGGLNGEETTPEEWEFILRKMLRAFELNDLEEKGELSFDTPEEYAGYLKEMSEGFILFGKWFVNLWD